MPRCAPVALVTTAGMLLLIVDALLRTDLAPSVAQTSPAAPAAPGRVAPASVSTLAPPTPLALALPTPLAVLRRAAQVYIPDMARDMPPERFEAGANPCWGTGASHRCLPAFFFLGVYQSGVHDLFARLSRHPGVAQNPYASPSFYSEVHTWSDYMGKLRTATKAAGAGPTLLIGECSAVTFHFVWVHQEQFNQGYVKAMGKFWAACNARPAEAKRALPHRDCMAARMPDARAADQAVAARAGLPKPMTVPQLMRAAYGDSFAPALVVMLRLPWARMHSAFHNYGQYGRKYGASAAGEAAWAAESVGAFQRCAGNFSRDACALGFESLARENEEVFYHCDQLAKGMYAVFTPRWRAEHRRILFLRSEDYFARPRATLARAMGHVGLAAPANEAGWARLLEPPVTLHGTRPKGGAPPMDAAAAALLRAFYRPSLRELAAQLADAPDAEAWASWAERDS